MKIYYRAGYKYQLQADYSIKVDITGYDIGNTFCHLGENGELTIHAGYAWDGPSGPTVDTKDFMRGSLIHDALYQLMREGLLPHEWREKADQVLYTICREDGMNWWRAQMVFSAVRLFGDSYADPANPKPIMEAP